MTGTPAAEFDVVVLGAGLAGGLPAAAYLQRAGGRVCLVEGGPECGPFYRSYDVAGIRFDHSPVNFSVMSPALEELQLGRYGYRGAARRSSTGHSTAAAARWSSSRTRCARRPSLRAGRSVTRRGIAGS